MDTKTTHSAELDSRNDGLLFYLDGKLVTKEKAVVSIFDSGFMLGDGIWEGLRLHNGKWLFLDQHLQRLFEGAKAIDLDIEMTMQQLADAIKQTQSCNKMHSDVHARVMVTRGIKTRPFQHPKLSQNGPTIAIIMEHSKPKPPKAVTLATVAQVRGLPHTQDPKLNSHSKLNCILAAIAAEKAGADEGLMLDINGFVNTTNSCNFFIVRNGALWTSTGDYCMNGITREKILFLAQRNAIETHQKNFSLVDCYGADEAFMTGSFGGITPVSTIDGRSIGSPKAKTLTTQLQQWYSDLINQHSIS